MSSSPTSFLRRVRIHGEESDAIARALHHKAGIQFLPAVCKNVLQMTFERKSMNRKTIFKRISLAVVAALGLGLLSSGPSQAGVPFAHTLTISAATASVKQGETATVTLTNLWSASSAQDSVTIRYTCSASLTRNVCPVPVFYQMARNADTSNVYVPGYPSEDSIETNLVRYGYAGTAGGSWSESISSTTAPVRSVINVKMANFQGAAGTFTYNFYTTYATNSGPAQTGQSQSLVVTMTAPYTAGGTGSIYISEDNLTADRARTSWGTTPADSAIVVDRGTVGSVGVVGYAFVTPKGSAGETAVTYNGVAHGLDIRDSVTVEVSGPGYVSSHATAPTSNYSKSAILDSKNGATAAGTETLTIMSDGTVGVSTLTFKSGATGATIGTKTVKFTGPISTISSAYFLNSETTVTLRAGFAETVNVRAFARDAGGELVTNTGRGRTLFLYSSDTKIVGDINGTSLPAGRVGTCTVATTGLWSCAADIRESGTVTLTLRDSSTVTASTISFDLGTVTVVGSNVGTMTATLDKATYAPGERAVLTLTPKDTQGRTMSGTGNDSGAMTELYSSAWVVVNTTSFSWSASSAAPYCGSVGYSGGSCRTVTPETFSPFRETGSETRVVTMPTTAGDVAYEFRKSDGTVLASVSAKVVDPNQTATNAAIAASQAAADAATDAALEAIDAANAATDAANLAAEAADAATVAAEEARDAADAATAAVEALATEVATMMAALKAQLTTLANTVAKIAKKVKA